jgi:transposase
MTGRGWGRIRQGSSTPMPRVAAPSMGSSCLRATAALSIATAIRPTRRSPTKNVVGTWRRLSRWRSVGRIYVASLPAAPAPAPVALEALQRIAQLYVIEANLRGRSAKERREGRQAHARPLVDTMERWLAAQLKVVSGKSDTAAAIRYAQTHWAGLTRYLDDGRIEMDTNAVERAMRPIKLSAKNSLFAGCDDGAEHWAMLASFIETCKLNEVNAEAWLADVLSKLVNGWPEAKLDELLPWAKAYTQSESMARDQRAAA